MTHSFPTRRSSDLQRDDLHDVRIRVAGIADGFQIGVADLPAGLDDLARKLDGGVALRVAGMALPGENDVIGRQLGHVLGREAVNRQAVVAAIHFGDVEKSEEHTFELQSLMRNSYAVYCSNTKHYINTPTHHLPPSTS